MAETMGNIFSIEPIITMGFFFLSLYGNYHRRHNIMQNYKEVCGTESRVWFEILPKEGKEFLKWAKSLGCVWLNGSEINPRKGADFFHFSIHSDGALANVAMYAWVAKQFESVPKYMFCEYKQGRLVSPKEYWQKNKR